MPYCVSHFLLSDHKGTPPSSPSPSFSSLHPHPTNNRTTRTWQHSETIQSLVPPATVTIVDPQSATYLAKIIPTASGTYSLRARLGDNQIGVGSDFIRVAETNAVSFSPRSQSASASRKKRQRCRSRSTSSSLGAGRPVPPSPPQQVRKHESRSSSTSNPRRKAVASVRREQRRKYSPFQSLTHLLLAVFWYSPPLFHLLVQKARTYERLRVSEKNPRSATSAKKSKKIDARRSERASKRQIESWHVMQDTPLNLHVPCRPRDLNRRPPKTPESRQYCVGLHRKRRHARGLCVPGREGQGLFESIKQVSRAPTCPFSSRCPNIQPKAAESNYEEQATCGLPPKTAHRRFTGSKQGRGWAQQFSGEHEYGESHEQWDTDEVARLIKGREGYKE